MTDLHTHILPGMDDGARTQNESLTMLRMERDQGVDTVVLTPHFYREKEEIGHFLMRRENAMLSLKQAIARLPEEERDGLPKLVPGAEVAWRPNMPDWEELSRLCMGQTRNLLLELPFEPWNDKMIGELYQIKARGGITPVIAHFERYISNQRKERIRDVLALGLPVQVSADALLHRFARNRPLKLLRQGNVQIIASDCHRATHRSPDLKLAMDLVRKKLGDGKAEHLMACANGLVIP